MSGVVANFADEQNYKSFEFRFFDLLLSGISVPRVVLGISLRPPAGNVKQLESRTKRFIYSEGSYYVDESQIFYETVELGNGNSLMKVLDWSGGDGISTIDMTVNTRHFPDGSFMTSHWNDKLKVPYNEDVEVAAIRSEYFYNTIGAVQFFKQLPVKIQQKFVDLAFLHTRVSILQKELAQCLALRTDCAVKQAELKASDEERDKLFANLVVISDLDVPAPRPKLVPRFKPRPPPQVSAPFFIAPQDRRFLNRVPLGSR